MLAKDKVVLVTGGTGFVGRHIVEELLKCPVKVRVPVHEQHLPITDKRIETMPADLTKPEDCLAVLKGVDYVIHAAGRVGAAGVSKFDSMSTIILNLTLTARMLHAAWQVNVERFVLLSSSTVYPVVNYPVKEEEDWSGPVHQSYAGYGWMKRYLEKLAEFVVTNSKIKIAILRPTAVYGRWDNFNPKTCHVIPALIRRAVEKKNPFVVWGTGDEVRDFLHVTDLARASLAALEKDVSCDSINIGYGKGMRVREIVDIILKAAGHKQAEVTYDASKPATIPFRMVDTAKAKRLLGFTAQVSLEDGLADTVKWYAEQFRFSKINERL